MRVSCPISGTHNWTDVRQFNLMFKTEVGSTAEGSSTIYLRPETAQGIFVNYLNVQKTGRMKLPFGIAQIGKAFRNEIVARQFIFPYARVRANGDAVLREARHGASMVRNVEEDPYGLASGIRFRSGKLPFPRP